jgi:hypothetical protein
MNIYKLINPNKQIIIVVSNNLYEAIQQAKKTDNHKFHEFEYTLLKKI